MNKKKEKLIDRFRVKTDTGKEFVIFLYQEYNIAEAFGEEPQEVPGIKRLITSTGKHVNKINETTYEILEDMGNIRVTRY